MHGGGGGCCCHTEPFRVGGGEAYGWVGSVFLRASPEQKPSALDRGRLCPPPHLPDAAGRTSKGV